MNQEQKAGSSNSGHKYRWPCSSNYDNKVLLLHAFKILQIVVTVKCFVTKTNIDVLFPLMIW